jgi:hypothetical protein
MDEDDNVDDADYAKAKNDHGRKMHTAQQQPACVARASPPLEGRGRIWQPQKLDSAQEHEDGEGSSGLVQGKRRHENRAAVGAVEGLAEADSDDVHGDDGARTGNDDGSKFAHPPAY